MTNETTQHCPTCNGLGLIRGDGGVMEECAVCRGGGGASSIGPVYLTGDGTEAGLPIGMTWDNGRTTAPPPSPGRYIKPAMGFGASGLPHGFAFNIEDAKGHITRLREQNDRLLEQVGSQEDTIAALRSELDYLRKMAKAYQETAEARGVERDDLLARVEGQDREIETLKAALERSTERNKSYCASVDFYEQESRSHDAALAEVKTEERRLGGCLYEANERLIQAATERETLKGQLRDVEQQRDNCLQRIENQAATCARLRGDIEELTIQRDTAIAARDAYEEARDVYQTEIASLRLEVQRLKEEHKATLARHSGEYTDAERLEHELREHGDRLLAERDAAHNTSIGFKAMLSEATAHIAALESVIHALTVELDAKSAAADAEIATVIAMAKAGLGPKEAQS